ncbi:MOSC domain-containing protein [Nonomuraea cavernae]|uniref:Sulfurase n=1 Tax=Nonomuraea cavernae TaxID=2045107 RepID=A0A918DGU7_9ACTN|nr:MOSC domain-containing protein [Nonomuraea cavernae]MCA2185361.1 MOSC domain-containing protein [Nonomuraea cavernae]GGO66236.1 sulfurase [Nonomuraea cavernae]
MRVISVNIGRSVKAEWAGKAGWTAIGKTPVSHRVAVHDNGLTGDERADKEGHGAPSHAVYSYAREDYDWWEGQLGRELPDGRFGENLTTSGLDVNGALLGERWRVGTTLLEVTGPRVPCVVFRNWMDEPGWIKRFTQAGRPGAYLRVVELGELGVGDEVEIVARPAESVTVAESFQAYHGDRELMRRIVALPGHAASWDKAAARVLGVGAS